MSLKNFLRFAILGAIATSAASAGTVDVIVTDSAGAPARDAVVSIMPEGGHAAIGSRVPERAIIDQRHETFIPLLAIVRKGGEVIFTNNDETMHQVYSFSPIRQFQFEIDQGEVSKPVVFDKSGVAAIGCNIHDNMVAYVFVTEAPLAAVTDEKGSVELRNVPQGTYLVSAWHPRLRVGRQPAQRSLLVGSDTAKLTLTLALSRDGGARMSHMHKADY